MSQEVFELRYESPEARLLEAIRKRAPEYGELALRLVFQGGRLRDCVITRDSEERIRLE